MKEPPKGAVISLLLVILAALLAGGRYFYLDRENSRRRDAVDNLEVEDEASILKLVQKIPGDLGYSVLAAKGPDQALRLAGSHPLKIELLITDVVMPGMNGKELAHRLREICPGLKALFMSGYTATVIAHQGMLDEGANFIQKPFSIESIAVKAREALEA